MASLRQNAGLPLSMAGDASDHPRTRSIHGSRKIRVFFLGGDGFLPNPEGRRNGFGRAAVPWGHFSLKKR